MKTIIKIFVSVVMIFSFTSCYPLMVGHRDGRDNQGHGSGREYRRAHRHSEYQDRNNRNGIHTEAEIRIN